MLEENHSKQKLSLFNYIQLTLKGGDMKNKQKYLGIGLLVATAALVATLGFGAVSAHDSAVSGSLIDKLVSRFNLNKDDVQKVFDEAKEERKVEMQKSYEERLNQAVDVGDLTADQRDKILAKQKEMAEFHQSLESKSVSEAREAMKSKREELEKWVDDNDIPQRFLKFGMIKLGRGPGMGFGFDKHLT